jgi:hypothetical protein
VLKNEARWLGERLRAVDAPLLSPLLNVGSATAEFRDVSQPWIDELIFEPLRRRAVLVKHQDIQAAPGVDIVGDLTDRAFLASLAGYSFRSILCSNVLEHIRDPGALCQALEEIVPPGGFIILTVPHSFPYHPDPIDTLFRPDVAMLAALFPRSRRVAGDIIRCGTAWEYVDRSPVKMMTKTVRRLVAPPGGDRVAGTGSFLPWLFREFQTTCVVMQRRGRRVGADASPLPAEEPPQPRNLGASAGGRGPGRVRDADRAGLPVPNRPTRSRTDA